MGYSGYHGGGVGGYSPRVAGYPSHHSARYPSQQHPGYPLGRSPSSMAHVHPVYHSPTPTYPPVGGRGGGRVPVPRAEHAGAAHPHTPRSQRKSEYNVSPSLGASGSSGGKSASEVKRSSGPSVPRDSPSSVKRRGGIKENKETIDSRAITSAHKRRSKAAKDLKESPGRLCIREAYPPSSVLNIWGRMMKAHDVKPDDGNPHLSRKNICFVWMPNASWASDGRLNGYVFTVEGKEGHVSSRVPTRVIPDMFPPDKLFHGTLCIRLPNESTLASRFSKKRRQMAHIVNTSPIQAFNRMSVSDMERKLNEALDDTRDFCSDGSFAGFYVAQDPEREWEETLWIVVHTGDKDISRTVLYFLKGMYDPTKMSQAKYEYQREISEGEATSKHLFDHDIKAMQETLRRVSETSAGSGILDDARASDSFEKEEGEEDGGSEGRGKKKGKLRRRRKNAGGRKRNVSKEYYSDSDDSDDDDEYEYYYDEEDEEDGYQEEDTDLLTVEERLKPHVMDVNERKAWKYIKVMNEMYRRTVSYLPTGVDPDSKGVAQPAYSKPRPQVSWEKDVIRESTFLSNMEHQVRLKRWRIAGRLANILGFDLAIDFNIHPEKRDVDNHVNVSHITTNTFGFNKKNAKTTYYCGSFCRRDIVGAIPVPVSPLTGIKILYGPSTSTSSPKNGVWGDVDRFLTPTDEDRDTVVIKRSYSVVDNDDDLGGIWSIKNEPNDSEDCFGAFPYGTGREASYLRLSPEDIAHAEGEEVSSRVTRAQQTSIGGVRIVPPTEWGPRGLWMLSGAGEKDVYATTTSSGTGPTHAPFRSIRNGVLFTWNDKRFGRHPKLAKGVYRPRSRNFQMRERNLGWKSTLGSLHLKPIAVQMRSPIDPNAT